MGNGRIEATEVDVAAKIPGRIREILVDEGDLVAAGQVLAQMDTATLEAQRMEAEAQVEQGLARVDTAQSAVLQRESEKTATASIVEQRAADLDGAQRRLARSQELAPRGNVPYQLYDDDRAHFMAARAALAAAQAQVAAADAALSTARAEVIAARAQVRAAQATLRRIQADIDDSALRAPRDGRVQYRVAQPGEVLPAGGRVLNMVDLTDVYMTFFLPATEAGRVTLGAEARLVVDALPDAVIPAQASFVADVAQFTPRSVETRIERERLMFRIKARIDPALLRQHIREVKTGVPGVAYIRLDPQAQWPANLQVRLP
jgi:HlyD family secretion protein